MNAETEVEMRKILASYEKLGARRVARAHNLNHRQSNFYLDLTNIWRTKTPQQENQYQAIRDSELFSEERTATFLRFNYRSSEKGTYDYEAAYKRLARSKRFTGKPNSKFNKGTMHVADLWSDSSVQ